MYTFTGSIELSNMTMEQVAAFVAAVQTAIPQGVVLQNLHLHVAQTPAPAPAA